MVATGSRQSGPSEAKAYVVVMTESSAPGEIERKLAGLRAAHRVLDHRIAQLVEAGQYDQLELQRMKKQKLALKDRIARLESARLPDIIA